MGILNRLSRGFTQADKTATRKRAAISAAKQKFTKETGAKVKSKYNRIRSGTARKGELRPKEKAIYTTGGYISPDLLRDGTPFFYKPGIKNNTGRSVVEYYTIGGAEEIEFSGKKMLGGKVSMKFKATKLPGRPENTSFSEFNYFGALKNPVPVDLIFKKLRSSRAYNDVQDDELEKLVKHLVNPQHAFSFTNNKINLLKNKNLNAKTYNDFGPGNANRFEIVNTQSGVKIPVLKYKSGDKHFTLRNKKRAEIARALNSNAEINYDTLKRHFSELSPDTLQAIRILLKGSELMKKLLAVANEVETTEEKQEVAEAAQKVASTTNSAAEKIVRAPEAPDEFKATVVAKAANNAKAASKAVVELVEHPDGDPGAFEKAAKEAEVVENNTSVFLKLLNLANIRNLKNNNVGTVRNTLRGVLAHNSRNKFMKDLEDAQGYDAAKKVYEEFYSKLDDYGRSRLDQGAFYISEETDIGDKFKDSGGTVYPVSNLEHGRTMWEKFRILRERREKRKERARRKKQAAKEMK